MADTQPNTRKNTPKPTQYAFAIAIVAIGLASASRIYSNTEPTAFTTPLFDLTIGGKTVQVPKESLKPLDDIVATQLTAGEDTISSNKELQEKLTAYSSILDQTNTLVGQILRGSQYQRQSPEAQLKQLMASYVDNKSDTNLLLVQSRTIQNNQQQQQQQLGSFQQQIQQQIVP